MYQNYSAITKYVATFVKIRTNDFMTYGFEREVNRALYFFAFFKFKKGQKFKLL